MIELERHIEILLLGNECVIVPDFGGFMTHEVSARYDAEDRLFLPPLRTLGFNPQLRMNDSVLVQSYVEAYDISYPEALRRVEDEVKELKQRLGEEGEYTMDGLGTLTVNQEGNYEFAPCEAGILSPSLYALS
ncbi:MAG: SPOR domain-containing protein, partial [Prevotella sp.]|nr:SPOR domain-containing protein [Prevotella sp.]